MVTTKLVIRLLDAAGSLLGWTAHHAAIRGDGCLRASDDVTVIVSAAGVAAEASVHWADLNTETRVPVSARPVRSGEVVSLFLRGSVILTVGQPPHGLPDIVVGAAAIGIPAGGIGATGQQ